MKQPRNRNISRDVMGRTCKTLICLSNRTVGRPSYTHALCGVYAVHVKCLFCLYKCNKNHKTVQRQIWRISVQRLSSFYIRKEGKPGKGAKNVVNSPNFIKKAEITREAMYVKRNIEARSRSYICRGKAISSACSVCKCVGVGGRVRAWVCVRVALLIQHATNRHIVICGPSGFTTLFDIISYTGRFSEKSYWT